MKICLHFSKSSLIVFIFEKFENIDSHLWRSKSKYDNVFKRQSMKFCSNFKRYEIVFDF